LELGLRIEAGVADGIILNGYAKGKEFALKGGSIGNLEALEKMRCKYR